MRRRAKAVAQSAVEPDKIYNLREAMQGNHRKYYRFNHADYEVPITEVKVGQSTATVLSVVTGSLLSLTKAIYQFDKISPDALAVSFLHPMSDIAFLTKMSRLTSLPKMTPDNLAFKRKMTPIFSEEFRNNLQ